MKFDKLFNGIKKNKFLIKLINKGFLKCFQFLDINHFSDMFGSNLLEANLVPVYLFPFSQLNSDLIIKMP